MNSRNHGGEGQNVGRLDGSISWVATSMIVDVSPNPPAGVFYMDDLYLPDKLSVPNAPGVQRDGASAEGRRSLPHDNLILN